MSSSKFEDYILISLFTNTEYCSKVFQKLKDYYFEHYNSQEIFKYMQMCVNKDAQLTYDAVLLLINQDQKRTEDNKTELFNYLNELKPKTADISIDLLLEKSEEWAKFNSFKHALYESINIVNKDKSKESFQKVMGIMENGFDVKLTNSNDYRMSWKNEEDRKRRLRMLQMTNTILTGFKPFDDLTGGIEPGTITCFLAPLNMGKTLSMAFIASCLMMQGLNVAIASLEISPAKYMQRIDANLLDLSTLSLTTAEESSVMARFEKFDKANDKLGDIEIEQFSEANVITLKMWLKNLYIEKKFTPDVVIIDYLKLMNSISTKDRSNPYIFQQEVSREVRQKICVEMKIPVISAVQSNRAVEHKIKSKGKNVEVNSADTGDSYGVPQNLDTYISQVEVKQNVDQYMTNDVSSVYIWRLIKSRNHVETGTRTMVGVSKSKQRLYDVSFGNLDVTKIINNVESVIEQAEETNADDEWFNKI
jgi:replicative DNA helicase